MSRPLGSNIYGDGHVVITRATAQWLNSRGVIQRLVEAEGERLDPVIYEDLLDVRLLASTRGRRDLGADLGTRSAPNPAPVVQSDQMSTKAAADLLGLKVRAVTRAIQEGRLPAVKRDGRWYLSKVAVNAHSGGRSG